LDEWIEDLPKKAGEAIGDSVRRHRDEQGMLDAERQKELEDILRSDADIASDAVSNILEKEANASTKGSVLPGYLEVLNTFAKVIEDLERPIVLKGFLHSPECLAYWHHHNRLSMLSLWTTTIQFSEISHAAYALTTPGSTHHLLAMHTGSLLAGWLCLPGGTCSLSGAHPLGNISQFHDILLDPKALDLTRHENLPCYNAFIFYPLSQ